MKTKLLTFIGSLALAGSVHAGLITDPPILDTPILGGSVLVAADGNVDTQFLGSDAGYFGFLYLQTPSALGSGILFQKDSTLNSVVSLGHFTAGTELVFRLYVLDTGHNFFTGDQTRNPDGLPHALAITTAVVGGSYLTTIGFEDLWGGGDLDYDDFKFSLTNTIDPPQDTAVPAPPVLVLLASGLAGLVASRRRRNKFGPTSSH